MIEGAAYGWPDDEPETPVPEGTEAPVGTWTPHTLDERIGRSPASFSPPGALPVGRVHDVRHGVRIVEHRASSRA